MKRFNNIFKQTLAGTAMIALALGATSCSDMLDTKPQGVMTSDQIGAEEAVQLMTSAYATLTCHYFGNNESFAGPITNWVFDVRSDDALKGGDATSMEGYIHQLEVGTVQSDCDVVKFKWKNNYFSIARCNTAIKAINASTLLTDEEKASYVAEMKTLRAYYWFDMLRIYERFPYYDETTENPNAVAPQKINQQDLLNEPVVKGIMKDLADSYNILPETQASVGRFNKYVAASLLARVALYVKDWATAETYADHVITSGKYQTYANFLDMSKPEFNDQMESIMAIHFSSASSPDNFNFCNCLTCTWSEGDLYGNGDDFYLASQDLINAFRTDANGLPYLDGSYNNNPVTSAAFAGNIDPRVDFTFGRIGMPWRSYQYNEKWCRNLTLYSEYSSKKAYPSPDSPYVTVGVVPWGASTLNFMLIRYSDVLLMKAEALIEQGKDLDTARILINEVRAKAARSVDPAYEPVDCDPLTATYKVGQYSGAGWNQDYARRAVRMERRLELAFEGLRWFDLVRWGEACNVMNNYYNYEVDYQSYYQGANLSDNELFFPVPLEQIDINPELYK